MIQPFRVKILLFFFFLCLNFECLSSTLNMHPKNWSNESFVKLLREGNVVSILPMREHLKQVGRKIEFDGQVYLVKLDNGIKAVFKPVPEDDIDDAHAEVAAYKSSILLGFPYIPPTIFTSINGKKGSLQLFVETNVDSLDPEAYKTALKGVTREDIANLKIFYFVFGQWDSGPHNQLIVQKQGKTYIVAIDNETIKNRQYVKYGSLPFVRTHYSEKLATNDAGKPFPFTKAKVIREPTAKKLKKVFGDSFPRSFYRSFNSYSAELHYVIFQNSLWRRFHGGDKSFVLSHTNCLPAKTKKKLQQLTIPVLKKIFLSAKGADFLSPVYLRAILERRDQVLNYFKEKKHINTCC